MKILVSLIFVLTLLSLASCSKGNGERPDKNKDRGQNEPITGSDEIFKKVADAIVQQNFKEVNRLYDELSSDEKPIKYNASCFNKKFANTIYYNLTLPQIAAMYATNASNANEKESIFKFILEKTEKITDISEESIQKTFIHYSCDNSKYPIHILAAYGHYHAMSILLDFIRKNKRFIDNYSLLIEQFPDPETFPGLVEYSKHNSKFIEAAKKYYKDKKIYLQGDYIRRTPLYTAAYYGHHDILGLLLKQDDNIGYIGCYDAEAIAGVAKDRKFSYGVFKDKCSVDPIVFE